MPRLHDPVAREGIRTRVRALRPDAQRRWGKMSVDQALWHLTCALEVALGRATAPRDKLPLPPWAMKVLVLNLPWPKGAPTNPAWVAKSSYDFNAERERCLRLMDDFVKEDERRPWPPHPAFGNMSGREWSRLSHKHLDHHLRQFGA